MNCLKFFFAPKKLIHKRILLHHIKSSYATLSPDQTREVKLSVPWGHISGKLWGNQNSVPAIALHGWQDNANSFDNLIPLLNLPSVLALDLPGHGHSSHLTNGKTYDFQDLLCLLHHIIVEQKWTSVPLITHSFGGSLGFAYAAMFPSNVKWLVNFDCARTLLTLYRYVTAPSFSEALDALLKIENQKVNSSPPAYKLSHMVKMTIEGSVGSIFTQESALILLRRGTVLSDERASVKKVKKNLAGSDMEDLVKYERNAGKLMPKEEQKALYDYHLRIIKNLEEARENAKKISIPEDEDKFYIFTRDPSTKVKAFLSTTEEFIIKASKHVTCPVLSMRASHGFLFGLGRKLYERSLENLQKTSSYFEHHEIAGTHHAHLNTPENLAPVINLFLKKLT